MRQVVGSFCSPPSPVTYTHTQQEAPVLLQHSRAQQWLRRLQSATLEWSSSFIGQSDINEFLCGESSSINPSGISSLSLGLTTCALSGTKTTHREQELQNETAASKAPDHCFFCFVLFFGSIASWNFLFTEVSNLYTIKNWRHSHRASVKGGT